MDSKKSHRLAFILLGLPLLVYPFLFLANIMSFAAHECAHQSHFHNVIFKLFIWSSTLYPISYLVTLVLYVFKKIKYTYYIPILHLFFASVCFLYWVC
ncbi:conserved membrane hypothetical protein [Tenacibaculum xiamenense]